MSSTVDLDKLWSVLLQFQKSISFPNSTNERIFVVPKKFQCAKCSLLVVEPKVKCCPDVVVCCRCLRETPKCSAECQTSQLSKEKVQMSLIAEMLELKMFCPSSLQRNVPLFKLACLPHHVVSCKDCAYIVASSIVKQSKTAVGVGEAVATVSSADEKFVAPDYDAGAGQDLDLDMSKMSLLRTSSKKTLPPPGIPGIPGMPGIMKMPKLNLFDPPFLEPELSKLAIAGQQQRQQQQQQQSSSSSIAPSPPRPLAPVVVNVAQENQDGDGDGDGDGVWRKSPQTDEYAFSSDSEIEGACGNDFTVINPTPSPAGVSSFAFRNVEDLVKSVMEKNDDNCQVQPKNEDVGKCVFALPEAIKSRMRQKDTAGGGGVNVSYKDDKKRKRRGLYRASSLNSTNSSCSLSSLSSKSDDSDAKECPPGACFQHWPKSPSESEDDDDERKGFQDASFLQGEIADLKRQVKFLTEKVCGMDDKAHRLKKNVRKIGQASKCFFEQVQNNFVSTSNYVQNQQEEIDDLQDQVRYMRQTMRKVRHFVVEEKKRKQKSREEKKSI